MSTTDRSPLVDPVPGDLVIGNDGFYRLVFDRTPVSNIDGTWDFVGFADRNGPNRQHIGFWRDGNNRGTIITRGDREEE